MEHWFTCRATQPRRAEVAIYSNIGRFDITAGDLRRELQAIGEVDQIDLRINSDGGEVMEGLAIYNLLRRHPARIEVVVDGIAASMASVIAMAGDHIAMNRGAMIMIHDPESLGGGNAAQLEKRAELLREMANELAGIYAARTRQPRDSIHEMMAVETWLGAGRAVALGFADEELDAAPIMAHANLSRFTNVPADARRLVTGPRNPDAPSPQRPKERAMDDAQTAAAETQADPKSSAVAAAVNQVTAGAPSTHETKPQKPGNWASVIDGDPAPVSDEAPDDLDRRITARASEIARDRERRLRAVMNSARSLGLDTNVVDQLLDKGCELEEVPDALIQVRARRDRQNTAQAKLSPAGARASIGFSNDDPRIVRNRMADAIAFRYIPNGQCPDEARKYVSWGPQDMMRELLDRQGISTVGLTRSEIVDSALHTTSDFPELLSTSANRIFLGSYEAAPQTYRAIAARRDFSNFQAHNMLRDGDFPTLQEVLEHGEFTRGTISESRESGQLKTYGRTFAITRQTLVNDTLGVFGTMVAKIGQAVARFENKRVWALVTSNPTLRQTGAAVFSAAHRNLDSDGAGGGGTMLSAVAIGAGRALMRTQESLDGEILNIAPAVLAVPAALETRSEQILAPLSVLTDPNNQTPASMRQLQIVTEALLDAASTTAWHLFASPTGAGANYAYGYLEGEQAPRVRTNDPFNVDGIEFQVRLDFHATAIDYRFGYKDSGAAG